MSNQDKYRILVIDDTVDILNQLQQILINANYDVFLATTGEKALHRLEATIPDLILLDIIMPGIDGYETCKRIKSQDLTANIPIIFMSALSETFDKVKAFGLGAIDYITKPLNSDELLVRIKTHLYINQLQKQLKNANTLLEEKVKQRTEELQKSEFKYRQLFEKSQEGIWVIDSNYKTTIVNPAMAKMIGYNSGEIIGKSIFDFLHPNSQTIAKQLIDNKKKGIQGNVDLEFVKSNNDNIFVTIEIAILDEENQTYSGAIIGVIDISERKITESKLIEKNHEYEALNEELRQMNEELAISKNKAEESDRLKTAFLQNMSHEIRTPMNAIVGFTDLLTEPNLSDEKRNSFVSIIQNSANQLLSIVSDILTISSLDTKQEKTNITVVNVNCLLIELLNIFMQQANSQNISLYTNQFLSDKASEIYTDQTKLTQILSNLISNSLKFTQKGFIEFGYTLKNNFLEFYVKDTGIGISHDNIKSIFERFRQAELDISKRFGGTGLGLSISKGFVELLNGEIWVESELDKGSVFYFTIPYNQVHNNQVITKNTKNSITILVAEDEEYNFLYIEEFFRNEKYKILHAKNGQEAVEISNTYHDIDLILMDIKMPVMDGYNAAKIIKQNYPDIPIIAQSAYALEHEIKKYKDAFDEYIIKPINKEELMTKVKKFIPS